ncbi:flagellar basal body P-ring formation chaperone FlgA [Persephonella sp.]
MERLRVNFIYIVLFVFLLNFPIFSETVIRLKDTVQIDRGEILLKDIAEINSKNQQFISYLEGIEIKKINGYRTSVTLKEIKNVLNSNFIDVSKIKFTGSQEVSVFKTAKVINNKTIEEDVKNYLAERYKDIKILGINIPKTNIDPPNDALIEINELNKTGSYIYLIYRIKGKAGNLKKIRISVRYKKLVNLVVANGDIEKGAVISEDMLKIVKKEMPGRDFYTDINYLVGGKAKVFIPDGEIIKKSMIIPDYDVKKKNNVKIIYSRNSIRIEIQGVALENGKKGDLVRIKNLSSGKVLLCKVIGKNTVLYTGGHH